MDHSIDIDGPDGNEAEQIIVDVLLVGYSIGVGVPEVAAAGLDSLTFLVPQGHLDDVLVSFLAVLFEFGFDGIGDVFAERVEICWGILLLGD